MINRIKELFKSKEGAAMVLAIGIMAVTVVISLSIMAYGYRTYKASLKDRDMIQTKELAVSTAGMIRKQIIGQWKADSTESTDLLRKIFAGVDSLDGREYTVDGPGESGYETGFDDSVTVRFEVSDGGTKLKVITKAKTDTSGYKITDTYEITHEGNDWTIKFKDRV